MNSTRHMPQRRARISFVLACALVSLIAAANVQAQGVGSSRGLPSSSGNHVIQGKIYEPSGKPVATRLRVTLESNEQASMSAVTDADGAFMFRGLPAGEYRLTVLGGNEFENQFENASIYREASAGGRTVSLAIHMRMKESLDPRFASVPKEALNLYKKGMAAAHANDTKKAIENLSKAVALHQNFVPALSELGVQYLKDAQIEKATQALQTVVALAPKDFQVRLNLGIALLQQRKFPEAEEQLRTAVQLNNASATAHMYLGMALMNQKKLAEAQQELETAVGSNSAEVAIAHKYLGGIYWGQRDYKRAVDELEMYLKLVPKAADAERTKEGIKELKSKL